jgi:hypothetical protein
MHEAAGTHRIRGGTGFSDNGIRRGYWVRCSCGWESDLCATAVLAEAGGEQHVQLYHGQMRRPRD